MLLLSALSASIVYAGKLQVVSRTSTPHQRPAGGASLTAVTPSAVPNAGGTLLTVRGVGFVPSNSAVCKFFYNAEGNAWGASGSLWPGQPPTRPPRLAPTPDPTTPATVLNSTHLTCKLPTIQVPLGTGPHSCGSDPNVTECGFNQTTLIAGPISIDISMDGKLFSGVTPQDPPLLILQPLFSASAGQRTYIIGQTGHLLLDVHPSLRDDLPQLIIELGCGPYGPALHLPLNQTGRHALSIAPMPQQTVDCTCKLHSSDSGTLGIANFRLGIAHQNTDYPVLVDRRRRTFVVDGVPFLPFGYDTHAPGATSRVAQLYLTSLGMNNYMHYFFAKYSTEALDEYTTVMDDAAQLGAWLSVDMIGLISAFDENQTEYLKEIVGNAVDHPAVWSYYVADDGVSNISVWRELLATLPPLKAVVKAQAGTEEAYLLSPFADATGGEEYWATFPFDYSGHYLEHVHLHGTSTGNASSGTSVQGPCYNILANVDKLSLYPMDWQPSIVYGDGGFIGPPSYFGRNGAFPQSIRFQWMLELARGLVGNTLFVFIPWLPFLLTESAAELGLATFEFVPFMFAPVGAAQPVLRYAMPALEAPAEYLSRVPPLLTKAWRNEDGAIMLLFINMRNQKYQINVSIAVPGAQFPAESGGYMPLEDHRAVPLESGLFSATLSPFDVQAFVFNTTKPAKNLFGVVINGGMESFVLPGHAVGWSIAGNALSVSGNVSAFVYSETRFAHTGYHCLRFTAPFDTYRQARLPLPLNRSELHSDMYTVTVWTRIYDDRAPRSLHLVIGDGDTVVATMPLSRAWAKLEAQVKLNSTEGCELALMTSGPGTVYLDDATCVADSPGRGDQQHVPKILHPTVADVNIPIRRAAVCTRFSNASFLSADGAPFIPTGFVMRDLVAHGTNHTWHHLRRLSSRGINLLLLHEVGLQMHGGVDVQLQLAVLDVAFACGQKVVARIQAPPGATSVWVNSVLKRRVQQLKDHPAILGWWLGSELTATDQANLYHSVTGFDTSSEHYVFASPNVDGSVSNSCNYDVLLLTVDHRRVHDINPPSGALTVSVVGHDPMLTASESRIARPLFHYAGARSSSLSVAIYGSILRGCIGVVHGGWTPGTAYSTENGMGEVALQLAEMLPALTAARTTSLEVSGPSGVLVNAYTEPDGTLFVVVANTQPQPVVAARIECSGWSLDTAVFTPFSTNNSLVLQASDNKATLTRLLQPFEVQIFRSGYTPPSTPQNCIVSANRVLASNCTLVEDPAFESLQLFYGRPTLWKMNIYDVMLFGGAVQVDASCGQLDGDTVCAYPGFYSSALVDRRFALPGRKHSLRVTRPYPTGDAGQLGTTVSLSVPLHGSGGVQHGRWNISLWHRAVRHAGQMQELQSVASPALKLIVGKSVVAQFPVAMAWTRSEANYACNCTTTCKAGACAEGIFISFTWPGQIWLGDISVSPLLGSS
eukprot:SAG31_NODE_1652_length_7628_cov_100.866118_5_plen_1445_part_00